KNSNAAPACEPCSSPITSNTSQVDVGRLYLYANTHMTVNTASRLKYFRFQVLATFTFVTSGCFFGPQQPPSCSALGCSGSRFFFGPQQPPTLATGCSGSGCFFGPQQPPLVFFTLIACPRLGSLRQYFWRTTGFSSELKTQLGMASTALMGQKADQLNHKGNVSAITQIPPLLLHAEQTCLGQVFQVKG